MSLISFFIGGILLPDKIKIMKKNIIILFFMIKTFSKNMERKLFYKWQWDTIRQIGTSNNYLKQIE
jgi:hypothetical protein